MYHCTVALQLDLLGFTYLVDLLHCKKLGLVRPLFRLFLVFFKQTIQILQQINVKMSIQYPKPGFELMTFW